MHGKIEKWLDRYHNKNTRIQMQSKISKFLEEMKITEDALVNMPPQEAEELVLNYQRIKEDEGVLNNSILSVITAPRALFKYLRKPLLLKGLLVRSEKARNKHKFSNGDLSKMFECADVRGKALISLASSLGWGISDVLSLDKEIIKTEIARAKEAKQKCVFLNEQRLKTHAEALGIINPLAIEWVSKWLLINKSNKLFDINGDMINKELQRIAKEAQIKLTGNVSFHCFRAWVFNSLIKAGFNEFEAKLIVGKSIPLTDATYLDLEEGIKSKYMVVYDKYLNIHFQGSIEATKKAEEVEIQLLDTQNAITSLSEKIVKMENEHTKLKLGIIKILDYFQKTALAINPNDIQNAMEEFCGILGIDVREVHSTKQLEKMVLAK